MAMLIHLWVVRGYFHTTTVDVSSCDRHNMASQAQNVYCLTLYQKSLWKLDAQYLCPQNLCVEILMPNVMELEGG